MLTTTTILWPLLQDNPGEPVPETVGHINPHCHHSLVPMTSRLHLLRTNAWTSLNFFKGIDFSI